MQTTSNILMVRPAAFAYNAETAVNNAFQMQSNRKDVQEAAQQEFDAFATLLQQHKINVTIIQDTPAPHTPDSIFPNNWISFHEDGTVVLYPMFAKNRRHERNKNVLNIIKDHFKINHSIDLTSYEDENIFLEGTGSMVLDRENKIAYACISPRTNTKVLLDFCDKLQCSPLIFEAFDANDQNIYHTNVMMCIADAFAVICLESIQHSLQRKTVADSITQTGKKILEISLEQMHHFAGNMLQVQNKDGEKFLVMSTNAYHSLLPEHLQFLQTFNPILHAPLDIIEQNGGGSARCMLAEIFLPGV